MEPKTISDQETIVLKPINKDLELLLKDFMAISEDSTQEKRLQAQLLKVKKTSAQPT